MQKCWRHEPDFGHLFDDMILANGTECRTGSLMLPASSGDRVRAVA